MSLLGAAAVSQVKDWGGGILCFLQNSSGVQPYSCLTSGRSDLAAIIMHGVLLSMKYCCDQRARQTDAEEGEAWPWGASGAWTSYLEDSGAVLEGVGVADVVDQADHVAGQVVVRQVVKVGEDFVQLRGEHRGGK